MAPTRRSSRKTGATNTPPLSTPGSQPVRQTTLSFSAVNTRSQSTPEARVKKHLLDLPAEIRVMIYQQMFPPERVDVYAIKGSLHKSEDASFDAGDYLAILTACRALYAEAKPVLYNNSEFCIHIRDHYWLHMWEPDDIYDMFNVGSYLHEPDSDEWIECNPWLRDPRSIVPVTNIRVLTLVIECSTNMTAYNYTWTGQMKRSLLEASSVQKLHIDCKKTQGHTHPQHATDLMFGDLGRYIRCRGTVTAEMDLALGSTTFNTRSYYRMLDALKGADKTHDAFSSKLGNLQSEHASTVQKLRDRICSLRSKTEERVKFTESQTTWTDYTIVRAVPNKLKVNIEGILNEMMDLESALQESEKEIALLQRRFESLDVRNKT